MFVAMKDGSLSFCLSYRKLNAVTARNSNPLSRTDECIENLGEAAVFSTMHDNFEYWQIEFAERHDDKTAFTSTVA